MVNNSLQGVRAAIGQSSQLEINAALALAVTKGNDAIFDFLLPRADPAAFEHQALRNTIEAKNFHALGRLLPAPDVTVADTLVSEALLHKWGAGVRLIIASLDKGAQLASALRRATLLAPPELVQALLPFSAPRLICDCLSLAARTGWWNKVPVLARALESPARTGVVVKLLDEARNRPVVDALLAFLPEQEQVALLAAHPELAEQPNGAACHARQHLESAIATGPSPSSPRL